MIFAEATFDRLGSSTIRGSIAFSQYDDNFVRVDINLTGVPLGVHGIHVHERPINFRLGGNLCEQAKAHFNGVLKIWSPSCQGGTPHGCYLLNTERHIGDLCNNIISTDGTVTFSYIDRLISLIKKDPNCVVGRSIIIHENEDDCGLFVPMYESRYDFERFLESKITGNAGKRIACANIVRI